MTPAVGAEIQNYIADSHLKFKRLNLSKFEFRMFSGEEKERLWFSGLLACKRKGLVLEQV